MIGEVRVYDAETKQLKRIEYPDGKVYLVMKNGRLVEPDKEEKEKETTPIEGRHHDLSRKVSLVKENI